MAYEYLLSALPALPDIPGEKVELSPGEFASRLRDEGGRAWALGSNVLQFMDIKVLERIFVGSEPGEGALFDLENLKDVVGLPHWLESELTGLSREKESNYFAFDDVWFAHYKRFITISQTAGCGFIEKWLPWEVGLRRALASSRSKSMGMEVVPSPTKELPGLSEVNYKTIVEGVVSAREHAGDDWRAADELVAEYKLKKLGDLAPIYSFNLDELMGYAVRFVVLKECEYLKR